MKPVYEYHVTLKNGASFPLFIAHEKVEVSTPRHCTIVNFRNEGINLKENDAGQLVSPLYDLPFTFDDMEKITVKDHIQKGRYLLFGGTNYYPLGGMNDFLYQSESLEEIKLIAKEGGIYSQDFCYLGFLEWSNVLDTQSGEIIQLKE